MFREEPVTQKSREGLVGKFLATSDLTREQRDRMFGLMSLYFLNMTLEAFERDLAEKNWVVLLIDTPSGNIQGFSTLTRLSADIDGEEIVAFYSGDTIVDEGSRGQMELPRLWGHNAFELAEALVDTRAYWFFVSCGYKTYRFLPVFFHEFYPSCRQATPPAIKKHIDVLAKIKFGSSYNPERGVVRFEEATPLRPDLARITSRRLKDPHISFFNRANPGHHRGDGLACLTELKRSNITTAGKRMLSC